MTKAKKTKASAPKRGAAIRVTSASAVLSRPPKPVKREAPLDRIAEARYVRPSRIFLRFADGFEGTWTFIQLGLDMSNVKPTTVKATKAGTYVKMKSKWGEEVQLDSSSLRVLVDPNYAAELENKLNAIANQIGL